MTTVAANRTQIACDLQATHSGGLKFKIKTKIVEIMNPAVHPHRFWVGLCGDMDSFADVSEWLKNPADFKKVPRPKGGDFIVLNELGRIYTFANPSQWYPINQDFYAVGSGMNYAMAAMEGGKTPLEAVKVAAKFDPNTGLGFKSVNIKK